MTGSLAGKSFLATREGGFASVRSWGSSRSGSRACEVRTWRHQNDDGSSSVPVPTCIQRGHFVLADADRRLSRIGRLTRSVDLPNEIEDVRWRAIEAVDKLRNFGAAHRIDIEALAGSLREKLRSCIIALKAARSSPRRSAGMAGGAIRGHARDRIGREKLDRLAFSVSACEVAASGTPGRPAVFDSVNWTSGLILPSQIQSGARVLMLPKAHPQYPSTSPVPGQV